MSVRKLPKKIRYPKRMLAAIAEVEKIIAPGSVPFSFKQFEEVRYAALFIRWMAARRYVYLYKGGVLFADGVISRWWQPRLEPSPGLSVTLPVPDYIGCCPPVMKEGKDGRMYSRGGRDHYQGLSSHDRARLIIFGETVICPDICASHLTGLMGLFGHATEVTHDPYDISEMISRDDVKKVVTRYLGCVRGDAQMDYRWGDGEHHPYTVKQVLLAAFRKYPFLEKITSADVNKVIHLEAESVLSLCDHVCTLTMHDGVITTDKSTIGGTYRIVLRLQKAYREKLGILPIVKCPPPIERYDGLMDLTDSNVVPVKWDAVLPSSLSFWVCPT